MCKELVLTLLQNSKLYSWVSRESAGGDCISNYNQSPKSRIITTHPPDNVAYTFAADKQYYACQFDIQFPIFIVYFKTTAKVRNVACNPILNQNRSPASRLQISGASAFYMCPSPHYMFGIV